MNAPRRVATEQHTAVIDGINTVVAEAGQVIPVAYDHLVPDHKAEPVEPTASRSTTGRRAAAAAKAIAETSDPDTPTFAKRTAATGNVAGRGKGKA